jgi:hypothetical protein
MAQNDRYIRTRDRRFKLGELLADGMNEWDAYKIAFPLDNNISTNIKGFKNKGIYPFGEVDDPQPTMSQSFATSKELAAIPRPYLNSSDTVAPSVATSSDTVAQTSVVDVSDSVLMGKIKTLVDEAVRAQIEVIKSSIESSTSVVKMLPRLKRTKENTQPTSFRFPLELVQRAKEKAKTDPRGSHGLNAIVEAFLFEYIGSPQDLLE